MRCRIFSHPKAIYALGTFGLFDALFLSFYPHFTQYHVTGAHYFATAGIFFTSAVSLVVADKIDKLEKRLDALEKGKSN